MPGEEKPELGQFDSVSVFADEPETEIRQIAVGAPGAVAFLKELVRAVVGDVPEVATYRGKLAFAEQVRLQAVECKLVFLLVRERTGLKHFIW